MCPFRELAPGASTVALPEFRTFFSDGYLDNDNL